MSLRAPNLTLADWPLPREGPTRDRATPETARFPNRQNLRRLLIEGSKLLLISGEGCGLRVGDAYPSRLALALLEPCLNTACPPTADEWRQTLSVGLRADDGYLTRLCS